VADEVISVDDDVHDLFALPTVVNDSIATPADVEVEADSLDKTEFIRELLSFVSLDVVNSTVVVVLSDEIDVGTDDLSLFVTIVISVVLSIFKLSNVEEAVVNCNFVLPSGVDDISPTLVDRWIFVSDIV